MESIEFYNVKTRSKVSVPLEHIKKTKFERKAKDGSTQVRYAVRAEYEGMKLVKFVSKAMFDELTIPEA